MIKLLVSMPLLSTCRGSVGAIKKLATSSIHTSSVKNNLLKVQDINQNTRRLEYAVRGPLVIRANELRRELSEGATKPYKNIISANIGDCHAMNQKPITFLRQMIACAADTSLLSSPDMPSDVKEKIREILSYCGGSSVGSYSDSTGVEIIRKHIANYIKERDNGIESDWRNIFLCSGATQGVKTVLSFINQSRKPNKPTGVMIPIPQYPLYSATLCEFGMHQASYYLNEDSDWRLDIEELKRAFQSEKDKCDIRAIVVINPGNPTGSFLSENNIVEILNFANEHNLMVIADEVYQHNIYQENLQFSSFKKVMFEKTNHRIELASLMSASKGYMGECGLRGGYCELANFNADVQALLFKGLSSWLCPSVLGQICMDGIVNPPKLGEPSYDLYASERQKVMSDLKRKAKLVVETFNSVEGIKCNEVAGAMYAFPRLSLPKKAIEAARKVNQEPDFFYAMQFLENHGVCVVPGSGFGQIPGTYHFRSTILPQPEVFEDLMGRFKQFHNNFLNKYS